jgi:hypothetical protein
MPALADLHLRPATLQRLGLPDLPWPVVAARLPELITAGEHLPLAELLHGLQVRAEAGEADWPELEPLLRLLAQRIAPPEDERAQVTARGETWVIEIGPVDLSAPLVTVQRDMDLIAAMQALPDGRLRVATFQALCGHAARWLIDLNTHPDRETGVHFFPTHWDHALYQAGKVTQFMASGRGEAHLSGWPRGLGLTPDGTVLPEWHVQRELLPRRAAEVAVELGVWWALHEDL